MRRTFQYASGGLLARLDLDRPERPFRGVTSIRVFAVAVFAALLVAAPARAQDGRDPGDLLDDGRRAFEREEYEAARADFWAYLDATASLTGPERMPQAEALYYIALMEPDASVAARHYKIIADEFPAASIADQAIFRLGQYDLVQGRAAEARAWFAEVAQNYPQSRLQPEIPLWIGRSHLTEGAPRDAADQFLQGFTRVKSGELPREMPRGQREALEAEYALWLATAWEEAGDDRAATQYWSVLTLDYPDSPQAAEAREALAQRGQPVGEVAVAGRPEVAESERGEAAPFEEEPRREEPRPEPPREEEPREEAPEPVRQPERAVVQPVRPVPEERVRETPRPEPSPAATGPVYLQVGAFASASNAADLSERLKSDGFNSQVLVAIVDGRGFYRVRIGPFRLPEDEPRAATTRSRLRERGYPFQQVPASP
ncbi:hypothetical protein BH18GEM1_BH18GEM1_07640 [soil metagenome]